MEILRHNQKASRPILLKDFSGVVGKLLANDSKMAYEEYVRIFIDRIRKKNITLVIIISLNDSFSLQNTLKEKTEDVGEHKHGHSTHLTEIKLNST